MIIAKVANMTECLGVLGTVLSTLYISTHLLLPTTLLDMCYYYYSHLPGEETVVQSFNNLFQVPRLISSAAWISSLAFSLPSVFSYRHC